MKVLITSGPTAVPIDSVRVITNTATGEIGRLFAESFYQRGISPLLLSGGREAVNLEVPVAGFFFYSELRNLLDKHLSGQSWDWVIHSAAVSDFAPEPIEGKLDSGSAFSLKLSPLPKLMDMINDSESVGNILAFKLESNIDDAINGAMAMFDKYGKIKAVVANTVNPYYARIVLRDKGVVNKEFKDKASVAEYVVAMIEKEEI